MIPYIVVAAAAAAFGFLIHFFIISSQKGSARASSQEILNQAKVDAERIRHEAEVKAKDDGIRFKEQAEKDVQQMRQELADRERRLDKRDDAIERKQELVTKREKYLEDLEKDLNDRKERLVSKERDWNKVIQDEIKALQQVSSLGIDEAKQLLLEKLKTEMEAEMSAWIHKRVQAAKEEANRLAREIVVTTIQRTAAEHTSENVVSTVDLPSEDMKGRIIGREGRNIRSFEKATGVDVVVDDTPGVVVVSGFDPVRREMARRAMVKLVTDGRIHPARIEEVVEKTREEMEQVIEEAGRKACFELEIHDMDAKVQALLGRLQFRTSYGQNILNHSIEVAHIMSVMASELGLDPKTAKRSGLLHDLGKAIDHEVEGGHPEIGAEFAKRHGEHDLVVNAIAAHHQGCESISLYPSLVAAADAISAARPGARRETLDRYIKRLEQLELVAHSFNGVEQAYAIQAGREVRVMVRADSVSDEQMLILGRDIANKVEEELRYPGEIKVTLIRETRVVEYAR
ncbi:MAG: ribonuclease Y [Planctomycetes bacterium]|nr:ribonuclease Y [Planctomycetota bacterium]